MSIPSLEELRRKADILIFDLDGTLIDSMGVWNQVDIEFLGKRGLEVTPEYLDAVKKNSSRDAAVITRRLFDLEDTPEQIMKEWDDMVSEHYRGSIPLKEGVFEYLTRAKELGFSLMAATALSIDHAGPCLRRCNIYGLFNSVITLDDMGNKINKSDPAIYIRAMENAGGSDPSRVVVFEDVPACIEGAKSGGFITCAVHDPVGLGMLSWDNMASAADYSIMSFAEALG